jgi:hypothetical protein
MDLVYLALAALFWSAIGGLAWACRRLQGPSGTRP